jgi:hypothetical protein
MQTVARDAKSRQDWLAQALKAVRRRRGLRPADVARLMGMPLRSYEHFEAGRGRLNRERVHQFASVLDADPYAILTAVEIGSPEFAVRCADNKLATIVTMALQDFDLAAGDAIAQLDAQTLTSGFERVLGSLAELAAERAGLAGAWLSERSGEAASADGPDRSGADPGAEDPRGSAPKGAD